MTNDILRPGAELCLAVRGPGLLHQHVPAAGQTHHHDLHPPEVRGGAGLLHCLRSSADKNKSNLPNLQVTLKKYSFYLPSFINNSCLSGWRLSRLLGPTSCLPGESVHCPWADVFLFVCVHIYPCGQIRKVSSQQYSNDLHS